MAPDRNPVALPLDCVVEIVHKPLGEKGEDAFAYDFSRPDLHSQAVFDGCGGAGAWQYPEYQNATGALVSAHVIAKAYLKWFGTVQPADLSGDSLPASFHDMAEHQLQALRNACAPMRVSGSMVKSFPCTASVALIRAEEPGTVALAALNAGDSRVYYLTPETGLIQLTSDDSQGKPDPMESLRDNPPMSNMLSADTEFAIRGRRTRLRLPCAVICATDGVFGYLRTPMDFEYLLLNTLIHADSFAQFESRLKEAVVKVTGDDSTCIISFYGWGSLDAVKSSLQPRLNQLSALIRRLDSAGPMDEFERVLAEIWPDYRSRTVVDYKQKRE